MRTDTALSKWSEARDTSTILSSKIKMEYFNSLLSMPNNGLRDYESYTIRGGATFSDTLSKLHLCIHRQPSDSCLNCRSHPSFFSYLGPEKKAFDDFEHSHLFHVWVLFVHLRPGTERKALPLNRSELPTVVQAVACKPTHHGRHSDRENRVRTAFHGLSWVAKVWKFCILPGLISWHSGIHCPLVYSADFNSIPFAILRCFYSKSDFIV